METKNQKPKLGLALSGGSALGVYHIGVLQSLADHGVAIDCISGTSAGAIVAACYAFGVPLEKLAEKSKKLSWYGISKLGFSRLGLVSNKPIGDMLQEILGDPNIEDATIPLAIVASDITTGDKVVFRRGNLRTALMASSCIPGLFVPVECEGRKLVDGGLTEHLPLSPLSEMQADVRIGVDLFRWSPKREPNNILDVIMNSIGILTSQQAHSYKTNSELMIEPHLEDFSPSDFKRADQLIRLGYQDATKAIPEIERLTGLRTKNMQPQTFWEKLLAWMAR